MDIRLGPMFFRLPDSNEDPVYQEAISLFDYYDSLRVDVLDYLSNHELDKYSHVTPDLVRTVMEGLWDPVPDFNYHWMAMMVASILYMHTVCMVDGRPEDGSMDTIMLGNRSVVKDKQVLEINGIVRWSIPLRGDGYGVLLPKVNYRTSIRREYGTNIIYLAIESAVGRQDIPEFKPISILE